MNTPVASTSKIVCHWLSGISSAGHELAIPAELTARVRAPSCSATSLTADLTALASVTSATRPTALPFTDSISLSASVRITGNLVQAGDRCSRFGQPNRNTATDTACRPGDEGYLIIGTPTRQCHVACAPQFHESRLRAAVEPAAAEAKLDEEDRCTGTTR